MTLKLTVRSRSPQLYKRTNGYMWRQQPAPIRRWIKYYTLSGQLASTGGLFIPKTFAKTSTSKMKDQSDKALSPSYVNDIVTSVQRDPEYGYGGRIHSIRRREYDYLGGNHPLLPPDP
jgi:hypothetical protein